MLNVIRVNAFTDNYIWLIQGMQGPGSSKVAIVDPGDARPVLAALNAEKLEPIAILITHHHGDHTGGIRQILSNHDIPVYGPANEHITSVNHPLVEGDVVCLDGISATFSVLDVAGHTSGHIAYSGHGMLFCGDTLFSIGCGRLFEGTAQQMHASLEKIRALPDETMLYCAHEYTLDNICFAKVVEPDNPDLLQYERLCHETLDAGGVTVPSRLRLEKRCNPFLRSHIQTVIDAAEQFAGRSLTGGSEVFATLRHWKDTLD
ncbi:MAG: hydroxyacylglutathione hydrolase [Gammaproteobacteria bacterium]|nr:MAG: hydroxyacylglutathione hydrolase [Gammaproteobacteria bacterium]